MVVVDVYLVLVLIVVLVAVVGSVVVFVGIRDEICVVYLKVRV